ncbi:hypothetical protein pb186bvf_013086 [Paramecium bursaria]
MNFILIAFNLIGEKLTEDYDQLHYDQSFNQMDALLEAYLIKFSRQKEINSSIFFHQIFEHKDTEKQYICIDSRCEQSNRLFKAKNDSHPHKSHDYQLYNEFQKLIKSQFPNAIRDQINQSFNKDELVRAVQQRSVQMHEYIKNFEENILKTIEAYDVLGADKASLNSILNQLSDQNVPQSINNQALANILKFSKLGPQKILDRWKKENEIILKEVTSQAEAALKQISQATFSSFSHIQNLQSPQILQRMNFKWSSNLKAQSISIREEFVYEKGTGIGLCLVEQILEKDQIQSITIEVKERTGNLYIGVIDYKERKNKGRKAFQFHDWNESGNGLYLLYHGGYIFQSNDPAGNAKKCNFTFDLNDKLILTWNGPESQVKIIKVGSNQQHIFKVNPDGIYHFGAGLFRSEIRLVE